MANVGTVQTVTGVVRAIAEDGSERILKVGDSVAENERIITGDGVVVIAFTDGTVLDLGSNSSLVLNDDVLNPEGEQTAQSEESANDELAALQETLLNDPNFDPTTALPATAAGGVPGAGVGGDSGSTIVNLGHDDNRGEILSGFETTGVEQVFQQADENFIPPDDVPTAGITTVLLDEDDLARYEGLAEGYSALSDALEVDLGLDVRRAQVDGVDDEAGGDDLPPEALTVLSGLLTADFGNDGVGDIVFNAEGTQPAGLTSGGEEIHYRVDPVNGHSLIGYIVAEDDYGYKGPKYRIDSPDQGGEDFLSREFAEIIFTAEITDVATGTFRVALYGPVDHPDGSTEDNLLINLGFTISDADGDTAAGILRLDIDDDSPVIESREQSGEDIFYGKEYSGDYSEGPRGEDDQVARVDEDDIVPEGNDDHEPGDDGVSPYLTLPINFGADGPADDDAVVLSSTGIVDQFGNALTSNGVELEFVWDSATDTLVGSANGETVISLSVHVGEYPWGGTYSSLEVNLEDNLDHPDDTTEDNLIFNITYTATDFDGDSVEGTFAVDADDDSPVIIAPQRGSVDEEGIPGGNAGDSYDVEASSGANGVLVIPELENDRNLGSDLSSEAKDTVRSFVEGGGNLVVSFHVNFINDVFGLSLSTQGASSYSLTAAAAGTDFASGPALLGGPSATTGLSISSLPAGSEVMYGTSNAGAVVVIPVGDGYITFIGWDWFNAEPLGSQDGGWLDVLDTAVSQGTDGTADIAVFDNNDYVDSSGGYSAESDTIQATLIDQGHNVTTFTGITAADFAAALPVSFGGDLPGEELTASGSLGIQWGADDRDIEVDGEDAPEDTLNPEYDRNVAFADDIQAPEGLTSNGLAVQYLVSEKGTFLTAFTGEAGEDSYHEVFTVSISDDGNGSYDFTLLDNLDHPVGAEDAPLPGIEPSFVSDEGTGSVPDYSVPPQGEDGSPGTEDDINLGFAFVATDSDGDTTSSSFTITVDDDAPIIGTGKNAPENSIVDEEGLATAATQDDGYDGDVAGFALTADGDLNISWGSDDNNDAASSADRSVAFDATQEGPTLLKSDGQIVSYAITENGTLLTASINGGGTAVFTVQLSDLESGSYDFTLLNNLDHDIADTEDDIPLTFDFVATDSDGDTASSSFTVTVDDDAPVFAEDGSATVIHDESAGAQPYDTLATDGDLAHDIGTLLGGFGPLEMIGLAVNPISGALSYNAGADGLADIALTDANGGDLNGVDSGLNATQSGDDIYLYTVSTELLTALVLELGGTPGDVADVVGLADNLVLGITEPRLDLTDLPGLATHYGHDVGAFVADIAFVVGLYEGGTDSSVDDLLGVLQLQAIQHPDMNDPDDEVSAANLIHITITDGDGDTATSELAITVTFDDDAPVAIDDSVSIDNTGLVEGIDVLDNDSSGADGYGTNAIRIDSLPSDGTLFVHGTTTQVSEGDLYADGTTFDYEANYSAPVLFGTKDDTGSEAEWGTFSGGDITLSSNGITGTVTGLNDSGDQNIVFQNLNIGTHDGTGIGVQGGDNGQIDLTNNEELTISFDSVMANAEIGLSSVGGYFVSGEDGAPDATAVWTAYLDGAEVASGAERQDATDDGNPNTVVINVDVPFDSVVFTVDANVNSNYSIQYIEVNESFEDSFTYSAIDGDGDESSAVVTLNGAATNFTPDSSDDSGRGLRTNEDTTITIAAARLLANDIDSNDDILTITSVQDATNGTVVLNSDGTISFDPADNYSGPATFTYTVSDGHGGEDTATATIAVTPVADAPTLIMSMGEPAVTTIAGSTTIGTTNFMVNGSFEDLGNVDSDGNPILGELTGTNLTSQVSIPGWTTIAGAPMEPHAAGHAGVGTTDGNHYMDLGASPGNSSIEQTFSTLTAGEDYQLTFDYRDKAAMQESGEDGLASGVMDVIWNGVVIATIDGDNVDAYESFSINVTATGSDSLVYAEVGVSDDNWGMAIDNVQLFGVTEVEPETVYTYELNVDAALTDVDNSETLSGVTITDLPDGVSISTPANDDDTYAPGTLIVVSDHELTADEINAIQGSVTSTEAANDDAATTEDNVKVETDYIDFSSLTLASWGVAQNQDQGTATVVNNVLALAGSAWKAVSLSQLGVTGDFNWANGTLTFETKVTAGGGELQGVLFESNLVNNNGVDQPNLIKVAGSQTWGTNAAFDSEDIGDGWIRVEVDLSLLNQSSGAFTNLVFVNDDDNNDPASNGDGEISFRNLSISDNAIDGQDSSDVLLEGTTGDDALYGGAGDDVLIGGAGDDILTGDDGADLFVWNQADVGAITTPAHDTVNDFDAGEGDVLDLTDLLSNGSHTIEGIEVGGDLQLQISDAGDNIVQTIDLVGVTVTSDVDAAAVLQTLLVNGDINDGI